MLAAVPLWGVAMAMQPVVGMNYGAGNPRRVRRAVHVFGAFASLLAIVAWGLATLFPNYALAGNIGPHGFHCLTRNLNGSAGTKIM